MKPLNYGSRVAIYDDSGRREGTVSNSPSFNDLYQIAIGTRGDFATHLWFHRKQLRILIKPKFKKRKIWVNPEMIPDQKMRRIRVYDRDIADIIQIQGWVEVTVKVPVEE